jgi:enoyl-CoA hydratase/carnithine racemase
MEYENIRFEVVEPHIARVTLDRPDRLNALNGPLLDELIDAVERIDRDDDLYVWLLTGAPRKDGRPNFGAGVDLRAFTEGSGVDNDQGLEITNKIDDLLTPSIAVIDGVCTTGAGELALACDFRVVGEGARISDWHLKNLGAIGAWGAGTRWARLVGVQRAKEILITGREVGAEEALRIGYATSSHASLELMGGALALARTVAGMNRDGVRMLLAHLDREQDMSRDESLRWAALVPDYLGVELRFEGKDTDVLGRK